MTPQALHTLLRADARRWPDHTDYWRFGPTLDKLTVPPTLASVGGPLVRGLFVVLIWERQ